MTEMTATIDPVEALVGRASPPTAPRSPVLPAGLLALAVLAATAAGLAFADDIGPADVVRAGLLAAWAVAGLAALARPPLHTLGIVVEAGTLAGAIAFAADEHGDAELLSAVGCAVLIAASFHVLLALPRGALGTSTRRWSVGFAYGIAVGAGVLSWAVDGELSSWARVTGWVIAVVAGLPASHRRYLASAGVERQRLQWLGCGFAVAAEIAVVIGALHLLVDWPGHPAAAAGAGTILLPAALAASSSPRLAARVDRLLVHTVSVGGLTLVVIAVYLVIVLGLGRVPTDDERQLLALSMAAAAVAALLYLPARERLADVGNRLVYGERHAPDEVLRTFGSRLTRAIPMDELLLQLAESLRKTMALSKAEVWTGTADLLERAVSVPDQGVATLAVGPAERPVVARAGVSGSAWVQIWLPALLEGRGQPLLRVAPVSHSGDLLGLIVAERPSGGDAFTEEDDRVLTELARQVGLALHNVQLDSALQASLDEVRRQAEELRASRARIVATADAERRKIERNLHDGAQQHLVALAVNLRLAKDIIGDDPETAVEMLDQLATDVRETIQELRDLAHGIYPPLLMDSGLSDALRAAAGRSPLDVVVEADGIGRYPTEVEAAIYFCCLEALQNAAKHAPGSHVDLRLHEESGGLLFEVSDDGPGFDAAGVVSAGGHGFVNMSDRLGAIGGTVRWDSVPGEGTTISGSVPLT
jgi:signal transduction histidine kinase